MIEFSAKMGAEIRQAPQGAVPFIGLKEPFVGTDLTPIQPFVAHNRPFVWFQGEKGFTLVELIVTLVVAAILLTLAAPKLTSFIQRDRLSTQTNDLLADLALARSEAIKRGATVIVCKTNNPTAAAPACNNTATDPWTSGRVIWFDNNKDGTVQADEVLRVRQKLDGADGNGNAIYGDGDGANGNANEVHFTQLGMAEPPSGSPLGNTQFVLCDKRGPEEALAVAIGSTGRARATERGKDKDGNALTAANCP
jgi:type IV fimbrial biogenesis protein FimT